MKKEQENIVAIMQARMGSSRLPGKIMMDIEGKPMLWHIVNRLRQCTSLDKIAVATSTSRQDDIVETFCKNNKINIFRGDEEDVLGRYYHAAKTYEATAVVRISGDCPLIDPNVVYKIVMKYLTDKDAYDYVSNTLTRTYPRGLDTETFSFNALERSFREAQKKYEREHVTVYMYDHPELFRLYAFRNDDDLSSLRWAVDEEADLQFVREIYKRVYHDGKIFFMEDVLNVLKAEPSLIRINKRIVQKNIR